MQAIDDIPDLSKYGLGVANNGGGTDDQEFTFPQVTMSGGEILWIVRDEAAYENYFGSDIWSSINWTNGT